MSNDPEITERRFSYVTVPITEEEAKAERGKELECLFYDIQRIVERFRELKAAPLPTETTKCVAYKPGDPGYETAQFHEYIVAGPRYQLDRGGEFAMVGEERGES